MHICKSMAGVPPVFNGYAWRLPKVATKFGYMILTSLAPVPGRPQKHPFGEFRISPRNLLCGVSLAGGGTGRVVGVDERVEGASGRPSRLILLDVDQVGQAAPLRPLVEP